MKKIAFINGSPRGNNSASNLFINELSKMLNKDNFQIENFSLNTSLDYDSVSASDIIVFAFPLYVDTLPSTVIEFLVNFEEYAQNNSKKAKVYSIVNCGFFEGIQTRHAIKVIKNFSKKVDYDFRFGVGIGAGEFMRSTKDILPLEHELKKDSYHAFLKLKEDIESDLSTAKENIFVSPGLPKAAFISSAEDSWIEEAKTMSISKEQLYAKPLV